MGFLNISSFNNSSNLSSGGRKKKKCIKKKPTTDLNMALGEDVTMEMAMSLSEKCPSC